MTGASKITLQEYVKEVCTQILMGVVQAQDSDDIGKYVGRSPVSDQLLDEEKNMVTLVKFDVIAEVASTADGKGKISVPTFASIDGTINKTKSDTNRISFEIPIAIPSPSDQLAIRETIKRESDAATRMINQRMSVLGDSIV